MDPASLSVAVVGLFITCTEGYHFLSDVYNAPKDIQDAARKIRIQANILAVWGEHFGIREEKKGGHSEISAEKKEEHEKLQLFLTKGKTFNGVHDVLSAISETFTDLKAMQERYGFILTYDKSKGTVIILDAKFGVSKLMMSRNLIKLLRLRQSRP